MAFTTFAFDGLKKGKKAKRSRSLGRIKRGTKRPKERICGCQIVQVKRKGGGTQPALSCPGNPMKKFVKKSDVAKLRKQSSICTTMLRPVR